MVKNDRIALLATAIVIMTGALWGLYWMPVRSLAGSGLTGAWGTVAITGTALFLLAPFAVMRWQYFRQSDRVALVSVALGGAAFALYSIAFVYGRVAIVILLFFLTPVWSTLIGRYVMGWRTTPLRLMAILTGLVGLVVMLGADGTFPVPRGAGEWMGLIAGFLWSVATTGIRVKSQMTPVPAAFVFALGAMAAALMIAPFSELAPYGFRSDALVELFGLAFATGGLWWGLSIACLMWATVRLEPVRVGILLMTEVLVGAVSAAVIAGEHLEPVEVLGGALVLCAGILEVWPTRRRNPGQSG